jgi:hypothetical protein
MSSFRDSYLIQFFIWSWQHCEDGLPRGLVEHLKSLLIEPGRNRCLVGSQYFARLGTV